MPEADAAPRPPEPEAGEERPIRPLVWWVGLATSAVLAGSLSLLAYVQGLPTTVDGIPQVDKVLHLAIGGMLAFFLDGVLRRRMLRVASIAMPLAVVAVLVPAGLEEFLQRYSPNRSSSFGDFAADVVGVVFGVWLSRRTDR